MTEGFRSPPPATAYPGAAGTRQDVTDTVHRVMGEGIAAPADPASGYAVPQGGHAPRSEETSTMDVAKDEAGQVAETAKQAGAQVAGTVAEEAGEVTAEAGRQAKQLLSQARSEVTEQAAVTQQRVADGLRSLAEELAAMAKNSEQDGLAADLAGQVADKAHSAAGWLADRDPGTLLDEVRSFARRKPGTYLAIALGAGVLAGRLTRGLAAPSGDATTATTPTSSTTTASAGPEQWAGAEPIGGAEGYDQTGRALNPQDTGMDAIGPTAVLGGPRGDLAP